MKTIKGFIISLLCYFVAIQLVQGQNGDILFTIADRDTVTVEEFMQMYERNLSNTKDYTTLNEYLNLYVNYKLKLLQAHDIGLDRDPSTIRQVEEYRNSLIKPYINNPHIMDSLVVQAYDRMSTLVRASQILISVPVNTAPSDTILYYQKARMVYEKALQGEDFVSLVDQYSDDPSVNSTSGIGNHGDLGYFTSMTMIYPFENAVYSLIEKQSLHNEILKDSITFCKTQFGYHIIKLTSVVPVTFSTISLAHIFVSRQNHSEQEAKDLIYKAYDQIAIVGFDSVVRCFSDDTFTRMKGGILANQQPNTIPPEYIDMYVGNPTTTTSRPFQTRFGWHIVKFIDVTPIPEFEFIKSQIYDRLSKDERMYFALEKFIAESKQYYHFKCDSKLLSRLSQFVSDSVFSATWQLPDINSNKEFSYLRTKSLFSIGEDSFTSWDFLNYIFETQSKRTPVHIQSYINKQYENYSNKCVLEYASKHIEEKYPQLQKSIREFEDGVLIFDLTDSMVWTKSLSDTVELERYYQENKSKYLYTERVDATIWSIPSRVNADKIFKQIKKYKKKGKSDDEIKGIIDVKYFKESKSSINYIWGRFEKGINGIIDSNVFTKIDELKKEVLPRYIMDSSSVLNRAIVIVVSEIMPISIKPFEACKGLVTSDYQQVLEKQWIDSLREHYPISIDYTKLDALKK